MQLANSMISQMADLGTKTANLENDDLSEKQMTDIMRNEQSGHFQFCCLASTSNTFDGLVMCMPDVAAINQEGTRSSIEVTRDQKGSIRK